MKRIVYTQADGTLAVVHPAPRARLCKSVVFDGKMIKFNPPVPFHDIDRSGDIDAWAPVWAETEAAFLKRIRENDVPPDAKNVQIVDEDAIPADRTFRGAWELDGSAVSVDMPRARDICRDMLREARKPLFDELDIAYQRAVEAGDEAAKAAIVCRKQELRNITAAPAIEAASTPEDLISLVIDPAI